MTFTNFDWKQDKEDEQGYYFVLTDTLHHLDYNVVLIKDNGEVMVNGDYINNVPQYVAAAIAPRLDYFMAVNKCRKHGEHHTAKKAAKPEPKKSESKKTEAKKDAKKPEPKKDDKKKTEAKKDEPKKAEKKADKKPEKKDDKKGKK